jgi:hypothetical protein
MAGRLFHCEACGLDIPVPAPTPVAPAPQPNPQDVPVAEVVVGAPAAPKASAAMDALKAQVIDRSGFKEMMAQLHGVEVEETPVGATSPGAPVADQGAATQVATGMAAPAAAAKPWRPSTAPPPAPKSRAAHHYGFKRVMRIPVFVVAGICVLVGGWCFLPHGGPPAVDPGVKITEPEVFTDAQGRMWAVPRGQQPAAHDDGSVWTKNEGGDETPCEMIVKDEAGGAWAVPFGSKLERSKSGKVFYVGASGFEEPAKSADYWLEIQAELDKRKKFSGSQEGRYLWFGVALVATGLVLWGLGAWMAIDVRTVERERADEEAAKAAKAPAAGPPPQADKPPETAVAAMPAEVPPPVAASADDSSKAAPPEMPAAPPPAGDQPQAN